MTMTTNVDKKGSFWKKSFVSFLFPYCLYKHWRFFFLLLDLYKEVTYSFNFLCFWRTKPWKCIRYGSRRDILLCSFNSLTGNYFPCYFFISKSWENHIFLTLCLKERIISTSNGWIKQEKAKFHLYTKRSRKYNWINSNKYKGQGDGTPPKDCGYENDGS